MPRRLSRGLSRMPRPVVWLAPLALIWILVVFVGTCGFAGAT
jgi:hypothetical protein